MLGLYAVHVGTQPLRFGDHFWQVRTGEMILAARRVIDSDPFSYTVAGAPWNNHQWGYEVLVALLHRAAGWGGFRLAIPLLVGGSMLGLWVAVRRASGPAMATLAAAVFVQFAHYKFNPASQTLCMALFFVAYAVFLRDATFDRVGRALGLVAFMLVWGNLTAEALIFLPFVVWDQGLHAIGARRVGGADSPDGELRRRMLLVGLVCIAPLLNPPGSSVLNYATEGSAVNRIANTEFMHLWEPAASIGVWTKWLARAIAVGYLAWAAWRVARAQDRVRALREVGPGLACVGAAAIYERYVWMLGISVALVLVQTPLLRSRRVTVDGAALAVAVALTAPFMAGIEWTPGKMARQLTDPAYYGRHLDPRHLPIDCTAYIRQTYPTANVATFRYWGGYVIWAAPETHIFIDGRNPEYPLEVHRAEQDLWRRTPRVPAILDVSDTDIVLTLPGWSDHPVLSEWEPVYESGGCAVYARRGTI